MGELNSPATLKIGATYLPRAGGEGLQPLALLHELYGIFIMVSESWGKTYGWRLVQRHLFNNRLE
jgi:hypothetical protein